MIIVSQVLYHHSSMATTKMLRTAIKERGYNVWCGEYTFVHLTVSQITTQAFSWNSADLYDMKGINVVDPSQITATMQLAIANSAAVIVCLSRNYKEDPDCQRICLYASRTLRKHVRLQCP